MIQSAAADGWEGDSYRKLLQAKSKALCKDEAGGQKFHYPPKVKITLTVVSTSTGSLLSR